MSFRETVARKTECLRQVFAVRLHGLVGRVLFQSEVCEELGETLFECQVSFRAGDRRFAAFPNRVRRCCIPEAALHHLRKLLQSSNWSAGSGSVCGFRTRWVSTAASNQFSATAGFAALSRMSSMSAALLSSS